MKSDYTSLEPVSPPVTGRGPAPLAGTLCLLMACLSFHLTGCPEPNTAPSPPSPSQVIRFTDTDEAPEHTDEHGTFPMYTYGADLGMDGKKEGGGAIDFHFNLDDYVMEFEPMELSLDENRYPSSATLSFMPHSEPSYSLLEDFVPADQRQYPAIWPVNSLNIRETPQFTFAWPLTHITINSYYGFRHHPIRKRYIFHRGVDFGGMRGEPIQTIGPGRVTFAGWSDPGCGNKVAIDHPANYRSVYCHLSAVMVESGMYISKGSVIGLVGSTGGSTGNHLHLEIYRRGHSYNPLRILRRGVTVDY